MKCGRCGFENRSGIIFCTECGASIGTLCNKCGTWVSPGDRYCGHCGYDLNPSQGPSPEKQDEYKAVRVLQRYIPEETLISALLKRETHKSGYSEVVVMACEPDEDISFLENLKKDELFSIKEKILDIIIRKINEYGGTVNQILGDRVIAFFGGVVPIKNAPLRAVQSAWSMHREMHRFDEKINKAVHFRMKIGIHSGLINIISIDENLRAMISDDEQIINLVNHLVKTAEPGSSIVTDEVRKIVDGYFKLDDMGTVDIPELGKEIKAYNVVTPMDGRKRFDSLRKGDEEEIPAVSSSTYCGGTPWKPDYSFNRDIFPVKIKFVLFFIVFYLILCFFLIWETRYPDGYIAYATHFADNFWIQFTVIISLLLLITYVIYKFTALIILLILMRKRDDFKLGNILVKDGYITDDDLDEALYEQQQRIGDILVKSGRISSQQLEQALEIQKKSSGRLGQILVDRGFVTIEDIDWALGKLGRKLGEILRDKGLISGHNLYWILYRQFNSHKRKRISN